MFQFTPSSKQLTDLLTKAASPHVFSILCNKLSMLDVNHLRASRKIESLQTEIQLGHVNLERKECCLFSLFNRV